MSENERLARDVVRYLDGLMTADEEQKFLREIERDPALKAELAAQQQLKEVTDGMSFMQVPDKMWDDYWKGIYRRMERGAGWFFLSIGLIIVLAFAMFHLTADFLLDPEAPLIFRIGVGAGIFGVIILLVSIGETDFAQTHDRYEEVER